MVRPFRLARSPLMVLVVAGAIAACGGGTTAPRAGAGSGAGHAATPVTPVTASGRASATASGGSAGAVGSGGNGDITLAFAGDVHFTGRTAKLLSDPATAFGPISSVLRSADYTVLNLETAITSRGVPQPKIYHFRTTPVAFTALRDAGVDLVTMANNHALDYGPVGLSDTLAAIRQTGFPVVGIGSDAAAAWAPYVVTVRGVRIAFVGVSQVAELASSWVATPARAGEANTIDLPRTLAAVRAARKRASVVVVLMHWGTEGMACPDPDQLALAPKLAAAGATIIVGSHAHMLQGSGWLGHTFVAYGMANFLWWETSYSTATGVLLVTLHDGVVSGARLIPATVSGTGQPIVDVGAAAAQALSYYRSLRICTGLSATPGP